MNAQSIRELIATPGPCATIVLGGGETNTATELKNALSRLGEQFAPIAEAVGDLRNDTKSKDSIIILSAPTFTRVFHAGTRLQPITVAADRFDLRTLLNVQNARIEFHILALSQNRSRLLRCTESSSEEIAMPGAPASLAEAMQSRQPDHVLDNRASGGPSMGSGAVLFGTSNDRDDKYEYLLHYFGELDKAVNEALRGSRDPLVPVGVEHEIALYLRVNTYPNLIESGIHGSPDGLEGGEMHRRALELLESRAGKPGADVPSDFDKRVGTGHASTRVIEIVEAAWEGRVSHLFLRRDASYLGTFDPVRKRVKHTDDPQRNPVDLIDEAGVQTILHGGEVKIVPASALPNGVPVCAIMRYPAIKSPMPAGITEAA